MYSTRLHTDFDWTTIHQYQDQPIKPIKQQDPTEGTTTPAAPTEVEGPPSSHLQSKTKQQLTSNEQGSPECNPTLADLPECNPAKIQVNTVEIALKHYSWMQLTKLLLYTKRITKRPAPVATRCTVAVAMVAYNLKFKQTTVKTVQ